MLDFQKNFHIQILCMAENAPEPSKLVGDNHFSEGEMYTKRKELMKNKKINSSNQLYY
jgi:hypothetical protein